MSNHKVKNTLEKMSAEIERYNKVVREGGQLENTINEMGGDISKLEEVRQNLLLTVQALSEAISSEDNITESKKLTEGVLDGDDEDGFMARSQLYFMARDAIQLHGIIGDRDNLPNWVSSKITAASEGIDSVRRYMEYNTQVKGNEYGPQDQMEAISQAEVEKLEDINAHSELALRLAHEFGTEEEQELVQKIHDDHMRRGHIERSEQMARDEIIRKYYNMVTEEYGPEDDEFHRGLHVALGGKGDFIPHRDRPQRGDRYQLMVPVRYQKAEDVVIDVFCKKVTCDPSQVDVKYTRGQRSVEIDGQTPHPNVLSSLNSTLDKLDTGSIKGMYSEDADVTVGTRSLEEALDEYTFKKTADELRKYADKCGPEHCDTADFNEIADMLEQITKGNILQAGQVMSRLNGKIRDMDTSPRELVISMFQAHGLMENNSAPQTAAHRRAQLPKKVKLKGFGPDAAKGNMGNPSARASLNPGTKVKESEERPYVCVHAKKGKHECHADSSYQAAKKAAAHWKLKSTAGIDAYPAIKEGTDFEGSADAADPRKIAADMMKSAKSAVKKKVGK